jgi:predicted AAA+ superfamily ATPase
MAKRYIRRSLEPVIRKMAKEFPAVVLTGPRQSGKTTLLRHLFGGVYRYISLEPPDVRLAASADPRGFIEMNAPPVIFDEVQYAPDLMPYIKERIDSTRARKGQYLLTGSQNLLLMKNVTESLAGRAAILRLLPLSLGEATGQPQRLLPWDRARAARATRAGTDKVAPLAGKALWGKLLRGGYPEVVAASRRDAGLWHASYVQTYLERDVRGLREIADLPQFQSFLRLLASRSAQLLNVADMSRDLGLAANTVKAWLAVLQATYQIVLLRPYFANVGKRLVKTPKVYFSDVGTLCYLVGLKDAEHAASGPMGGAIIETAVVSEIQRRLTHAGMDPEMYFWRTSAGSEVDIVAAYNGTLVPIEVKTSSTPRPAMAAGIRAFQEDMGPRAADGFLIHPGDTGLPMGPRVSALPFGAL